MVQYEPDNEIMLLFGYFFSVFLLMDLNAFDEHFPILLYNKLGMGK